MDKGRGGEGGGVSNSNLMQVRADRLTSASDRAVAPDEKSPFALPGHRHQSPSVWHLRTRLLHVLDVIYLWKSACVGACALCGRAA